MLLKEKKNRRQAVLFLCVLGCMRVRRREGRVLSFSDGYFLSARQGLSQRSFQPGRHIMSVDLFCFCRTESAKSFQNFIGKTYLKKFFLDGA